MENMKKYCILWIFFSICEFYLNWHRSNKIRSAGHHSAARQRSSCELKKQVKGHLGRPNRQTVADSVRMYQFTYTKGNTAAKDWNLSSDSFLYLYSLSQNSSQLNSELSRDTDLSERVLFLSSFQVDVFSVSQVKCLCCHNKKVGNWSKKKKRIGTSSGRSCLNGLHIKTQGFVILVMNINKDISSLQQMKLFLMWQRYILSYHPCVLNHLM